MDLLYFILFISILIFIHEFGHFAFAKLFGVKVLTFSIGFGPKVLKVRGKETEYCIGILPFGGFVKMLEEGKSEQPKRNVHAPECSGAPGRLAHDHRHAHRQAPGLFPDVAGR